MLRWLVLCLMVPTMAYAQEQPDTHVLPRRNSMREMVQHLTPAGQEVFHKLWADESRAKASAMNQALQEVKTHIAALVKAEPFDALALQAAYARKRVLIINAMQTREERVVAILSQLKLQDRLVIADYLQQRSTQRGERQDERYGHMHKAH